MKSVRQLLLASIVFMTSSGIASSAQIILQLDDVTITGATIDSIQTYVPGFPVTGSGYIDFGLGTGSLSLADYSIIIDIVVTGTNPDAQIDVSGWEQTISSIDAFGNITSTASGTFTCLYPPETCSVGPPASTGWPPADGGSSSSAVIDTDLQTITVVDNSNDAYTGTVTQFFSYTIVPVPEPSTGLLIGGGLAILCLITGRRRA